MDLVNRLKLFLETGNITISQFADSCAIPRPTMTQILKGRNAKISDKLIAKIHEAYPSLSVLWLMFGEGPMVTNANIATSKGLNGPETPQTQKQTNVSQPVTVENKAFSSARNFPSENLGAAVPRPSSPKDNTSPARRPQDSIEFGPDLATTVAPRAASAAHEEVDPQYATKYRPESFVEVPGADAAETSDNAETTVPVDVPVDGSKTITNIVVFYSDNSFQSFRPV